MSLRVIWQYMDQSVTKTILYKPQKLRSIYYFFGDGPVHILPYDPQCHELFAINVLFSEIQIFLNVILILSNTLAMLRDWNSLDRFRKYAFLLIEGYVIHNNIIYYTLRLYFPYLSLIASRSIY